MCAPAGRLDDKAAIVRKAALQLLAALMHSNPFAPVLAHGAFKASLQEYQAKLQVPYWPTITSGNLLKLDYEVVPRRPNFREFLRFYRHF